MNPGGFRAYQQLEHSDCGPTCIRMMARYYGRSVPPEYIRSLCDCSKSGISLAEMASTARKLGFFAEAVKIGMADTLRMPLPQILYWNQSHFVVLHKISRNGSLFHIADPSAGKVRLKADEFRRCYLNSEGKGIAVLMEPEEKFHTMEYPPRKSNGLIRMLRGIVSRRWRIFLATAALLLLVSAADVAMPFLFQRTVDDGIALRDIGLVWLLVCSQLCIFVGNYISGGAAQLLLTRLGLRTGIEMMDCYLRKLASRPMEFFDRKVNSDLIQKIDDQNRIRGFLIGMPHTILLTLLNILIFSGLMIWFSPAIFVFFMVMTGLSMGWSALFIRKRREIDYTLTPRQAENRNNVYELIYGMQEIKANNALHNRLAGWTRVQEKINRLSIRATFINLYINGGSTFLSRLKEIIITGLCAAMVIDESLTIGGMMTVSYLVGRLAAPLNTVLDSWLSYQDSSMSYERLEEILDSEDAVPGREPVPETGDIILDNVTFKYPGANSPYVISGLDMRIQRGKTTAIVGASGCGKSTLLKLLLNFYSPAKGSVSVGGTDLRNIDPDDWLRRFGAVMQEGYIFAGTIAQNIAVGEEKPDLDRVKAAAGKALLDDFVSNLPMGYSTKIGVTGMNLSGGQKQRLFIARAIYRDPEILILDEATSSLDASNERHIVDNLRELAAGRTIIIVAHRLSTVRSADHIYFMRDGQISEHGAHDELTRKRGGYWNLVRDQLELNIDN